MRRNSVPNATSPFTTWLTYIEYLHNKPIDMGLERVKKVATRLDVLKPAPFVFTVTGTNGKGTTCRTIEMILIAAGYQVGVYSSPHLVNYTERVRVRNIELSETAHIASFIEIEAIRDNISLTYFEYCTLSALWLFKKSKLDVVILEVGLGGRLDATNIVDADIAVITSVALDHTDLLGADRASIGYEKAGIFRSGKQAIIGELDMPHTIAYVAKEKKTHLLRYGVDWRYTTTDSGWCFTDNIGQINNLPMPQVPQCNAATALAALRASNLVLSNYAIYLGIRDAILPCRFQIIRESPRVILDVAHNPHAATYLAKRLVSLPKIGLVLAVIGMLNDKDIGSTLSCINNVVDCWYLASLNEPRGASIEKLKEYIVQGKYFSNVEQAWKAAMIDAKPEDTILVCGSFYTVAHVMRIINSNNTNGN